MGTQHFLRIGVMTSGGDAPGMNACIRALVKGARTWGAQIVGIRYGGVGLLRNSESQQDFKALSEADVTGIIDRSGTILKTAREEQLLQFLEDSRTLPSVDKATDFLADRNVRQELGRRAREVLESNEIDGLILIGGDQTCRAAMVIDEAYDGKLPIIVIPGTIDNDVDGTQQTIGFDSAVAGAVQAVDAVRASAISHDRIFIVQVMGRDQGHIAGEVALACGAEEVLVPEHKYGPEYIDAMCARMKEARDRGRASVLVIVAEGVDPEPWNVPRADELGAARALESAVRERIHDWEVRVAILGHVQRGAAPTPVSRNLAARFALAALDAIVAAVRNGHPMRPSLIGLTEQGAIELRILSGRMVRQSEAVVREVEELVERLAY